jgi:citrate synthase
MSAADAARTLGVSRTTLYAYVSRKLVRSQAMPGARRERAYARDDLERLRRRTEERRNPDKAAARVLQWGLPVLETSLSLIDGRHLYYRGHDAIDLAQRHSMFEVASLMWTGHLESPLPPVLDLPVATVDESLPFIARAQVLLALAAAKDPAAFDTTPARVALCGWRILHLMARAAAPKHPGAPTIEQMLVRAWRVRAPASADLLRSALVLCADHELNVSSFTARCVASAGATPYAVVLAGLAALGGTRHGGTSARAESMLASLQRERNVGHAVAARLQRGERMEGFGHPLYPHGDPRAAALLQLLRKRLGRSAELTFVQKVVTTAVAATGHHPNIDFALAATACALRLPQGAPLTLFALGRTIGWIGHAIEQYATGQFIRPRAKYIGPVPGQVA